MEINDFVVIEKIRGLYAVDGSDGQSALIGRRRSYDTGIGVTGQSIASVLFGTERRIIIVSGRHNQRDPRFADTVVNFTYLLFIYFSGKACGRTEGHIDDVYSEIDAVLQSR